MENTEVKHYQVNHQYKVQFERSAVKGTDGFKVEANGDDASQTVEQARALYAAAQGITTPPVQEGK